jgi:hypothetical protein
MAIFHFNTMNGRAVPDKAGVDLRDKSEAMVYAQRLANSIKSRGPRSLGQVKIVATDDKGVVVFECHADGKPPNA